MHPLHRSKLADLSQEVLAVQECYISVCKEKDKLEENLQSRIDEERKLKDNEVLCHIAELHVYKFYIKINEIFIIYFGYAPQVERRQKIEEAQEKQKADFASQHQEAVAQLKAQWTKDKEMEIQLQVTKQLASAKKSWQEGQQEVSGKFTKYN